MDEGSKLFELYSYAEFLEAQKVNSSFMAILFYKGKSTLGRAVLEIISQIAEEDSLLSIFVVNLEITLDIHQHVNVTSVPTFVIIKNGKVYRNIEGKATKAEYEFVISDKPRKLADGTEAPPLRVTVYSTTSCPHCVTVKNYLKKKNVRFRDVDLNKDQKAAEELIRRSGSAGVPQIDINGEIVVGADISKINRLIGIK
jgi:glutaredoxin-like YruB-family protein